MDFQKRFAILFSILLLFQGPVALVSARGSRQAEDYTTEMLDAMMQLMEGGDQYDRDYMARLYPCLDSINPLLRTATDMAWGGMVQYSDQNGVPGDEWGSCLGEGHCVEYLEQNATSQDFHNITIYEPCNYASNMAYYHVTTQICDRTSRGEWSMDEESVRALGEVFAHLAVGSAFWHGSHTLLGNLFDNRVIEILSWVAYQGYIRNLDNYDDPVIKDLRNESRPYTAIEISDQLTDMFLNQPVEAWTDTILGFNMPDYYMTFAAIVVSVLTVSIEDETTVENILFFLKDLFNFPEDEWIFVSEELLPKMRNGTESINLGIVEKTSLVKNFLSAVIKLLYAFLWQEWVISDNPILFEPETNAMGYEFLPVINAFANDLSNFPIYDQNLQDGIDIYPGETWCNPYYPHCKWHLEAAAGLTDLLWVSDQMHSLTSPDDNSV